MLVLAKNFSLFLTIFPTLAMEISEILLRHVGTLYLLVEFNLEMLYQYYSILFIYLFIGKAEIKVTRMRYSCVSRPFPPWS